MVNKDYHYGIYPDRLRWNLLKNWKKCTKSNLSHLQVVLGLSSNLEKTLIFW